MYYSIICWLSLLCFKATFSALYRRLHWQEMDWIGLVSRMFVSSGHSANVRKSWRLRRFYDGDYCLRLVGVSADERLAQESFRESTMRMSYCRYPFVGHCLACCQSYWTSQRWNFLAWEGDYYTQDSCFILSFQHSHLSSSHYWITTTNSCLVSESLPYCSDKPLQPCLLLPFHLSWIFTAAFVLCARLLVCWITLSLVVLYHHWLIG